MEKRLHTAHALHGSRWCCDDPLASHSIAALTSLPVCLCAPPPAQPLAVQQYLTQLLPAVVSSMQDEWYRIVAETLRVASTFVKVMRPLSDDNSFEMQDFDWRPLVMPLFNALKPRIKSRDIDQEIKECAIATGAVMLAYCGDSLTAQTNGVLNLLLRRMKNDITRMPALRAYTTVANSPLKLNMSGVLPQVGAALSAAPRLPRPACRAWCAPRFAPSASPDRATAVECRASADHLTRRRAPVIVRGWLPVTVRRR